MKGLVSLLTSRVKKYRAKIRFALSTNTSINIQMERMAVVSPLNDIYYYSLYYTRVTDTSSTDTTIHIQIEWLIAVLVQNNIFASG